MSEFNTIIFYPAIFLIVIFVCLTIKCKNIFYSLLSAMIVFILSGIVFYILGAEYNAIAQILIYGLAVPVILGLGILFTDTNNYKKENPPKILRYTSYLISGLFILSLFHLHIKSYAVNPAGFNIAETIPNNFVNTASVFGWGLYVKYIFAFELMAALSLLTIAGLSLFKKEGKL